MILAAGEEIGLLLMWTKEHANRIQEILKGVLLSGKKESLFYGYAVILLLQCFHILQLDYCPQIGYPLAIGVYFAWLLYSQHQISYKRFSAPTALLNYVLFCVRLTNKTF